MIRIRCRPAGTFALLLSIGIGFETGSLASPPAGDTGSVSARTGGQAASGTPTLSIPPDRLESHVPDPQSARQKALEDLERARQAGDKTTANNLTRILERIDTIRRPEQLSLSLEDALRRALANNYVIQTLSYNPAIETTRVTEAEAAFDAVFFSNITKNNVDRPTGSQLFATDRDYFTSSTGIRKLLASGMQVSGSYGLSRTKQEFAYQLINPEYFSSLVLEMRQPVLRGFGLDFNRSLILIAKNDRRISDLAFRRQVRDTLRQVEEIYWRLVQGRREVVVSARELADFEAIYRYLVARKDFDILPVQISATKADLERARADFVQRRANVFDAEDRLIAAMNDPEINLADQVEILPADFPHTRPIAVDRLAEVQTALDNRTEIKEQQLRIASAKVAEGRAKNTELPRLDLTFRVTADGLAGTADGSFDELTRNKFIEYFVGVELEVPIGNRGPRASHHRARLQHSQAVSDLRRVFEDVILDANLAVRKVQTSRDQIGPIFESAEAREREVGSIVARAERNDFNTLKNELGAWQSLAATRRGMLNAMVEYNIAIIDLERAKGTLLQYNNVVISTEAD